ILRIMMHKISCKNKSASAATKETCSNYQCDQFYLFIFFMTKLLIIKGLCANRVWFLVPILSAHFIDQLYFIIAELGLRRSGKRFASCKGGATTTGQVRLRTEPMS